MEKRLQMYDSIGDKGQKDANEKLKSRVEEIFNEETQQEWTLERTQVPLQTDTESCGYRMLYNINKVCNPRELETIEEKETALEGYIIEIMKMLKEKQQSTIRKEEEQGYKNTRKERKSRKGNRRSNDDRGYNRNRK